MRICVEQQPRIAGAKGTRIGAHELLDALRSGIGGLADATKNGDLGIRRPHGLQHALNGLGIDVIVGVHKEDDFAPSGIDAGISSARDTRVFLVNHQHAIVGLRDLSQDTQ